MTQKDLTTQIFYRSLFDAAERFYKKDPETALEIYHSYFRYAFGLTEGIETDNEVAELLVKQNVPNLDISTENYLRACNNGQKGKENGGGIGRPRKGETPEEYKKRVEEWKQSKNPEKPLKGDTDDKVLEENPVKNPVIEKTALQVSQNPEKPLTYTYTISNTYSKENILDKDKISNEENIDIIPTCKIIEEEKKDIYSSKVNIDNNSRNIVYSCFNNFINTYKNLDYQLLLENPEEFLKINEIKLGTLSQNITTKSGIFFSKEKTNRLLEEYINSQLQEIRKIA